MPVKKHKCAICENLTGTKYCKSCSMRRCMRFNRNPDLLSIIRSVGTIVITLKHVINTSEPVYKIEADKKIAIIENDLEALIEEGMAIEYEKAAASRRRLVS